MRIVRLFLKLWTPPNLCYVRPGNKPTTFVEISVKSRTTQSKHPTPVIDASAQFRAPNHYLLSELHPLNQHRPVPTLTFFHLSSHLVLPLVSKSPPICQPQHGNQSVRASKPSVNPASPPNGSSLPISCPPTPTNLLSMS